MPFVVPTIILSLATVNDLWKKKIFNWLALFCLGLAIASSVYVSGSKGLLESLMSGGLAFIITFPLFLIKALGGGDVKIFTAFGASVSINTVLSVFLYSLFWGTVLGILMLILNKGLKSFGHNLFNIITFKKSDKSQLHKIPYAVALLCGWVSYLIINHYGRAL